MRFQLPSTFLNRTFSLGVNNSMSAPIFCIPTLIILITASRGSSSKSSIASRIFCSGDAGLFVGELPDRTGVDPPSELLPGVLSGWLDEASWDDLLLSVLDTDA